MSPELIEKEVKRRIILGTYVLSAGYYDAYYLQAQKVRRLFTNDFKNAFEKVDVILSPTTPTSALMLGSKSKDPLEIYLNDIYTISANLAGICAISLPCGKDPEGLPLGLQLMGRPFEEQTLFETKEYAHFYVPETVLKFLFNLTKPIKTEKVARRSKRRK